MNLIYKKKAIIYDLDNTLVATDAYVQEHLLATIQQLNFPNISPKTIVEIQKKNLPFEDIFKELFRDNARLVLEKYRETAPTKPYFATPGAVELTTKLKEMNVVQGILTNRTKMAIERLNQAGFPEFSFVLSSLPEFRKPHSLAFEPALQWLAAQGINKTEILTFGDHLDDYLSANAAGIDFYAVLTGQTTKEEFLSAGLTEENIFKNMEQLACSLFNNTTDDKVISN
ncbi:MAG: HAD hydrolase-like protein [Nanoarchaeota archaeon]